MQNTTRWPERPDRQDSPGTTKKGGKDAKVCRAGRRAQREELRARKGYCNFHEALDACDCIVYDRLTPTNTPTPAKTAEARHGIVFPSGLEDASPHNIVARTYRSHSMEESTGAPEASGSPDAVVAEAVSPAPAHAVSPKQQEQAPIEEGDGAAEEVEGQALDDAQMKDEEALDAVAAPKNDMLDVAETVEEPPNAFDTAPDLNTFKPLINMPEWASMAEVPLEAGGIAQVDEAALPEVDSKPANGGSPPNGEGAPIGDATPTNGEGALAQTPYPFTPNRVTGETDMTDAENTTQIPFPLLDANPLAGLDTTPVKQPLIQDHHLDHGLVSETGDGVSAALIPSAIPDGLVDTDAAQYLLQLPQIPFPVDENGMLDNPYMPSSDGIKEPQPQGASTGFAKLEFHDGSFYMTTYAIEIGRDLSWSRQMRKQKVRAQAREANRGSARSARSSSVPGTPLHHPLLVDGAGSYARSFVSDGGGMINDDGYFDRRPRSKKGRKTRSTDESSHQSQVSRKNSISQTAQSDIAYSDAPNPTVDPNVTAPLNPLTHMPDPDHIPHVPLHPPRTLEDPFPLGKGISRKHLRISYSFERGKFEMKILGGNGAFHDQQHYSQGDVVELHDNSHIAVGDVHFHFLLPLAHVSEYEPDPVDDPTESQSGRMSFGFEDGRGASIIADDDSIVEGYDSVEEEPHPEDVRAWQELNSMRDSDDADLLDEDDEDEDEDDASDESDVKPRMRVTLKHKGKPPKGSKYRRTHQVARKPVKAATKLKVRVGAKQTAKEKAKAEAQAKAEREREREREREAAKAKKAAAKAKEAQEKAAKAQLEKESKEQSKEASAQPPKDSGTEEGKTVKEPAAPRIARDAPMENGTEINIPGLPTGVIIPPRKKGPGRPPKDGFMSKREKALLVKQNKEKEKAIKMGLDPSLIPMPEDKPPKPRPRKNSQGEEVDDDGGKDADGHERKSKPPRPPRSPSPEMRIEDYTEEQLQRPTPNYVYLIYEAIENSKTKVLNLQQIYSAIERRHPFFKFRVTSNGWQSSVRHNLGQHEAFKKVEKEGKGWLWGIKEGVPIERERKKKTPPPQVPPNQAYPHHPQPYGHHQPYGGYPPNSGAPGYHGNQQFAQARQHPPAASLVPPSLAQQALKPPPSLAPPSGTTSGQQTQTYSSPYAKDANKAGEGSNGSTPAPRPSPYQPHGVPYASGGHPAHSASPYQSHLPAYGNRAPQQGGAPRSTTPPGPPGQPRAHSHQPPRPRYNRPAQDVINTFKQVFIQSMQGRDQSIDAGKAEDIVNKAIRRVLEPEFMANVPPEAQERAVTEAFEKIVKQSQGPPRQTAPGQSTTSAPTVATNAVATAAMTAAATAGASGAQAAPPVPARSGLGIDMGQNANRSKSPSQPPAAGTKQPQPQRPAQANLMNMLMGGGGSAAATTGTPLPKNSASPVNNATTAAAAPAPAPSTPVAGQANGNAALPNQISQLLKTDGVSTPTRPSMEPLTPPMFATSPAVGSKRAGSPVEGEGKRVKVDEAAKGDEK